METPLQQQVLDGLAYVEADYKHPRMTEKLEKAAAGEPGIETEPAAATPAPSPRPPAPLPRNAACSCGSGLKYKRCCGRNAPGVLNFPAGAAPAQSK